jgi:hypothetical protein
MVTIDLVEAGVPARYRVYQEVGRKPKVKYCIGFGSAEQSDWQQIRTDDEPDAFVRRKVREHVAALGDDRGAADGSSHRSCADEAACMAATQEMDVEREVDYNDLDDARRGGLFGGDADFATEACEQAGAAALAGDAEAAQQLEPRGGSSSTHVRADEPRPAGVYSSGRKRRAGSGDIDLKQRSQRGYELLKQKQWFVVDHMIRLPGIEFANSQGGPQQRVFRKRKGKHGESGGAGGGGSGLYFLSEDKHNEIEWLCDAEGEDEGGEAAGSEVAVGDEV